MRAAVCVLMVSVLVVVLECAGTELSPVDVQSEVSKENSVLESVGGNQGGKSDDKASTLTESPGTKGVINGGNPSSRGNTAADVSRRENQPGVPSQDAQDTGATNAPQSDQGQADMTDSRSSLPDGEHSGSPLVNLSPSTEEKNDDQSLNSQTTMKTPTVTLDITGDIHSSGQPQANRLQLTVQKLADAGQDNRNEPFKKGAKDALLHTDVLPERRDMPVEEPKPGNAIPRNPIVGGASKEQEGPSAENKNPSLSQNGVEHRATGPQEPDSDNTHGHHQISNPQHAPKSKGSKSTLDSAALTANTESAAHKRALTGQTRITESNPDTASSAPVSENTETSPNRHSTTDGKIQNDNEFYPRTITDVTETSVAHDTSTTPAVTSTGIENKVDSRLPLPPVSNTLPLHHSVDKTDFSLGSSSLLALAALATLAVAAAAPAH